MIRLTCRNAEYLSLSKTESRVSPNSSLDILISKGRFKIAQTLSEAVQRADAVQEQGPETVAFKQRLCSEVESLAPSNSLFWSSTSGIPASVQSEKMKNKDRLMILHPFNPPHIMPLLEVIVPETASQNNDQLARTKEYWKKLNREPVQLHREVPGFVANRLAFALLREAAHLVESGIVTASDLDNIVEQSMGPRWAVRGPFWSYHAGGGQGGLREFLDKVGGTVQACWDDAGSLNLRSESGQDVAGWQERLCRQVEDAYGRIGADQLKERDDRLRSVLDITQP